MTNLYLIAHKVRGLPAFDVAHQILCPECIQPDTSNLGCVECDGLGFWWIAPTSGHRAYPYWYLPLQIEYHPETPTSVEYHRLIMDHNPEKLTWTIFPMPEGLPDHYTTRAAPTISLIEALGLAKPKPNLPPIVRRF